MLKGAIIGFGNIAEGHLNAYKSLSCIKIIAILDKSEKRLEYAKELIPDVQCYTSFSDMIKKESLDFVDICTPPNVRFTYMKKSLENNFHVIGEKPFLFNLEEYQILCEVAQKNKLVLFPCHNYKYAPVINYAKKIITNTNFGYLINGYFKTMRTGHALGNFEWKPDWRRNRSVSGGGILQDHGPHSFYIAYYLVGKNPLCVSAMLGKMKNDKYKTEDTAIIKLQYEDDLIINLDLSWSYSKRDTFYHLFGSKESILIDSDKLIHYLNDGSVKKEIYISEFNDPLHRSWFIDVLSDFKDSIKNMKFRNDLLEESYLSTELINKAYESARENGTEKIILGNIFNISIK